ncbi:MAG: hypothetical protein AAGG01_08020 [Planctomycetota bacterium]
MTGATSRPGETARSTADGSVEGRVVGLLQVSVALVLLGRGWLTYRWSSPIRGLLWDEVLMTPILARFGIAWPDYAAGSDAGITLGLKVAGVVLTISALLVLLVRRAPRAAALALMPSMVILLLDGYARYSERDFEIGMGLEGALQWGAPMILLLCARSGVTGRLWKGLLLLAAAATFTGHGLYAVGFHPVPWQFEAMVENILGTGPLATNRLLLCAGLLDFAAVTALWWRRTRMLALGYMVIWGAATALARPVANDGLDPWLAQLVVRTPHWAIPLALLVLLRSSSRH